MIEKPTKPEFATKAHMDYLSALYYSVPKQCFGTHWLMPQKFPELDAHKVQLLINYFLLIRQYRSAQRKIRKEADR